MNYTHIVFDVDGTLLNTAHCILQALKDTLKTVSGATYETDELNFALGMTSENVLRHLNVKEEIIPSVIDAWVKRKKNAPISSSRFPVLRPCSHS